MNEQEDNTFHICEPVTFTEEQLRNAEPYIPPYSIFEENIEYYAKNILVLLWKTEQLGRRHKYMCRRLLQKLEERTDTEMKEIQDMNKVLASDDPLTPEDKFTCSQLLTALLLTYATKTQEEEELDNQLNSEDYY